MASSPLLCFLHRHPYALILTCFFFSGAAGLIYEVVWARRLTLIFGVTVLSHSTVLAAFLGGLAVGSLIFGRLADRRRDLLRVYAILEALVGLFCFATPYLFALVEHGYVIIHPTLEHQLWLLRLVRFGLAALVMFVPTMLMGGTLPVLSRARIRRLGQVGTEVGVLYGVNTLGAVLGAVAAGFFLLPTVGLKGSIYLAAVINLAVALTAFALSIVHHDAHGAVVVPVPPREGPTNWLAYGSLLVAYGISGTAALIYEVVWTRVLSLAFGTSVYAFSGMLAAFLAGIALGSLVPATRRLRWVDRLQQPLVWFGLVEVAIAAVVTAVTPVLDGLPFVFLALFRWIGPRFLLLELAHVSVAFLIMVPAAGLMGFAFPLVARLATEHLRTVGRRLSAIYAANTCGTVVGSFAAGFILIPLIGARWTLAVAVALNLLVGLVCLTAKLRAQSCLPMVGLVLAGLVGLGWAVMPDWNREVLSSGVYVYPRFYSAGNARKLMQEKELLYYRDALTASISVTRIQTPVHEKPILSLQINGKTDASSADLSTQLILGHLPTLLCAKPRSALVIGLASGCTLGALEAHPEYERLDCVEIEPEMVRVTDFFRELNRDCLNDPRARLFLNDALNYVLVSRTQYDVITSEPSNPWIAGIGNLFTLEHFRLCRNRLTPEGVFCQWVPIYNLAPEDFRCIAATFLEVFPQASLWIFPAMPSDAYLIGTLKPFQVNVAQITQRMQQLQVGHDLRAAKLRDVWDILTGYVLGPQQLATLSYGAPLNTDDFPLLEFSAPLRLYTDKPRQTFLGVVSAGAFAVVPVQLASPNLVGSYRSQVAGLELAPPWKVQREITGVLRSPQAYLDPSTTRRARLAHSIIADLGASEAEIRVARPGELLGPDGSSLESLTAPNETVLNGTHEVSVWRSKIAADGFAWVARWICPQTERVYLIRVRAADSSAVPSPQEALAALSCIHEIP
ncbi:MAG: fused MFS/spermidine synthase [Candidatus Zipacnadales bacterium]